MLCYNLSPFVGLHLVHDEVLLLPVEAASDELDLQRLSLHVVGVAVTSNVTVEHRLVQLHLPLDVGQVRDLQQMLAVLAAMDTTNDKRSRMQSYYWSRIIPKYLYMMVQTQ